MFLLSPQLKHAIKRSIRHVGLLGMVNRIEYAYGNRFTPEALRLYSPFVSPGSLCFDIGAHRGLKTKLFRELGASVIAVEPDSDCIAAITDAFQGDARVVVVEAACGEADRRKTFFACPLNPQNSTLSRRFVETSGYMVEFQMEEPREVTLVKLDTLIQRYGRPDFCKIDCEGYEPEVLSGLSQPLPVLSFEFRRSDRDTAFRCVERLSTLNFNRFNLVAATIESLELETWCSASELVRALDRNKVPSVGDIFAVCSSLYQEPVSAALGGRA